MCPESSISHRHQAGASPPISDAGQQRRRQLLGWMHQHQPDCTFARYMQSAMMHPQLGYYSSQSQVFGAKGDFSTAAVMTPVYARCLARRWCELIRACSDRPFTLLEIGPGNGQLLDDVLEELDRLDALPDRCCLFEPSPSLTVTQQQALARWRSKIELIWLDNLDDFTMSGVIYAGEVVDVLPVEIVRRFQSKIEMLYVVTAESDEDPQPCWRPCSSDLARHLHQLEDRLQRKFTDDYWVELPVSYRGWLKSIRKILVSGQLWVHDYGYDEPNYFHPERDRGTLKCFYRHRLYSNPFQRTGLQDMSVAVNFDALYRGVEANHWSLQSYQTLARWMLANGALELVELDRRNRPAEELNVLDQRFKQMMMPDGMGELFKLAVFCTD